jgi:protein-tyrosine phosphatase
MIDYHCHILPGLDDGCQSVKEAIGMAGRLHHAGFTRIYCTPHCITGLYDISSEQLLDSVARLQLVLEDNDIPLTLIPGMEYYLDDFFVNRLEDPVTLGDSELLLFEIPSNADVSILHEAVLQIKNHGLLPVMAHPERYFFAEFNRGLADYIRTWWRGIHTQSHVLQDLPESLRKTIDLGCYLQADMGSFNGLYGREVQQLALTLRELGLYSFYGSDGHNCTQLERILTDNICLS